MTIADPIYAKHLELWKSKCLRVHSEKMLGSPAVETGPKHLRIEVKSIVLLGMERRPVQTRKQT